MSIKPVVSGEREEWRGGLARNALRRDDLRVPSMTRLNAKLTRIIVDTPHVRAWYARTQTFIAVIGMSSPTMRRAESRISSSSSSRLR